MKQFLIIGAGRFGNGLTKELARNKQEVVVCDRDEKRLEELDEYAAHCIIGDFKDNEVLKSIEINNFDSVFVAIGSDEYSAILITKHLKELGAQRIVAKANSRVVGEILRSLGADRVIYPEEEAGVKVARQEMMAGVIEYIEITKNVSAIEVEVPDPLIGKTLEQLNFSKHYALTVSLIIRNGEALSNYFANIPFEKGDCFLLVGENEKIEKFKKKFLH